MAGVLPAIGKLRSRFSDRKDVLQDNSGSDIAVGARGEEAWSSMTARRLSEAMHSMSSGKCIHVQHSRRSVQRASTSRTKSKTSPVFTAHLKRGGLPRCRPRLSKLPIMVAGLVNGSKTSMDVAHLQDYDDPLKAFRELLFLQYPSRSFTFEKLDNGGTGNICAEELFQALKSLHVDWQQVTGLTKAQMFNLFNPGEDGRVSIMGVLGVNELTPRASWTDLSLEDQWNKYVNELNICESSSVRHSSWDSRTHSRRDSVRLNFECESSNITSRAMSARKSIYQIAQEIDNTLRQMCDDTKALSTLKKDIICLKETSDLRDEAQRRRDILEMKRRETEVKVSQALHQAAHSSGLSTSIFRDSNYFSIEHHTHFFSLQANPSLMPEAEIEFREILREVRLPYVVGDKLRRSFVEFSENGSFITTFEEFVQIMARIKFVHVNDVHECPRFKYMWRSMPANDQGQITLANFLKWYSSL